jgi:hypothetical protein
VTTQVSPVNSELITTKIVKINDCVITLQIPKYRRATNVTAAITLDAKDIQLGAVISIPRHDLMHLRNDPVSYLLAPENFVMFKKYSSTPEGLNEFGVQALANSILTAMKHSVPLDTECALE